MHQGTVIKVEKSPDFTSPREASCLNLLVLFMILFLSGHNVSAQKISKEEKQVQRILRRESKIADGKLLITPLAGPAYTPELGFAISGGIMLSFKTNPKDMLIQRSSVPIMLGVSSTGAFFISTKTTTFWKQDSWRIYTDINFKDMPDNYYGIGYESGFETPRGDSTTGYTRTWVQFYPRFLYQFKKHHFFGPAVDINYTKGRDPGPVVEQDITFDTYNDRPFNAGLGLIYQFDSRDIPVNAWSGWFLELTTAFYGGYLGGDNDYQLLGLDFRKYWRLGRDGRTFAFQARGRLTTGEVPYGEMSQLGTPYDLRAYRWGQYREESMLYFIGEYRHQIQKKDETLSKSGFVVWFGGGTLGETIDEIKKWLPSAGVGYRFEIQPRMNLRLDLGFGRESNAFYFNFNEAF